jgi:Tfp pilus assembly protein PilF
MEKNFDATDSTSPDTTKAYVESGIFADKHENDKAIEDFTKAISINPDNTIVYYN